MTTVVGRPAESSRFGLARVETFVGARRDHRGEL
jgi:hypothetical protein